MIPGKYHFVWFGPRFPFTNALSIYSLYRATPNAEIFLHLSECLANQPHYDTLVERVPGLTVRIRKASDLAADLDPPVRERLAPVCRQLEADRAWGPLSDIARYAILTTEGGVYLDFDTLTVRDLTPLLATGAFCGREVLVVTGETFRRGGLLRYFRTTPLDAMRAVCARVEPGYRWFSRIEPLYPTAINGAVLGVAVHHPLLADALAEVPRRTPELKRRRAAIGPDLLQDLLARPRYDDVTIHGPRVFYPLGPTMAAHLSRRRGDVDRALEHIVSSDTHVVHWYNDSQGDAALPSSVKETRALSHRQIFSRLALRGLEHVGL